MGHQGKAAIRLSCESGSLFSIEFDGATKLSTLRAYRFSRSTDAANYPRSHSGFSLTDRSLRRLLGAAVSTSHALPRTCYEQIDSSVRRTMELSAGNVGTGR